MIQRLKAIAYRLLRLFWQKSGSAHPVDKSYAKHEHIFGNDAILAAEPYVFDGPTRKGK